MMRPINSVVESRDFVGQQFRGIHLEIKEPDPNKEPRIFSITEEKSGLPVGTLLMVAHRVFRPLSFFPYSKFRPRRQWGLSPRACRALISLMPQHVSFFSGCVLRLSPRQIRKTDEGSHHPRERFPTLFVSLINSPYLSSTQNKSRSKQCPAHFYHFVLL